MSRVSDRDGGLSLRRRWDMSLVSRGEDGELLVLEG